MPLDLVKDLEEGKTLSSLLDGLPLKTQQEEISRDKYRVFIYAAAHSPALLKELITRAEKIDKETGETNIILGILKDDKLKILQTAVEYGRAEAVKHLLEAAESLLKQPKIKANNPDLIPNMLKARDAKLLKLAAEKGHTEVFKLIRDTLKEKKMAPKEMSTWLEILCEAAKSGNKDLFDSVKGTIDANFQGQLITAPKPRAAKEKSVLEYQFFDAIVAALKNKNQEIAIELSDTIFKHEGEDHYLSKSLFSMGETGEVKEYRHGRQKTGDISPRKLLVASAEQQIKQKFELFITALEHDCYDFFTQTLTTLLNDVDADLAESAIEYSYAEVDSELAEESILMSLAQGNQESLDLMNEILGVQTGEKKGSPTRGTEPAAKRQSPEKEKPEAETEKKPIQVYRSSKSASAANLTTSSSSKSKAGASEEPEMTMLSLPKGIGEHAALFTLTGVTRAPAPASSPALEKPPVKAGGAYKSSKSRSVTQLSGKGNDGQGAGSAEQ